MSEPDPLKISGTLIADKYSVEHAVGSGGFAVVYRALHTIWKRPVAIKFFTALSDTSPEHRDEMQQAFINEGALLTELSAQTAGIVQARDVGTHTTPDGHWIPFMVLEWLEGRSLEEILVDEARAGRPRWSLVEVMRLLGPIAAALDVAHGRRIAHRDVKPANIFVLGDPRSADVSVKILDFGVAKLITDGEQLNAALARTGTRVTSFTPEYGAPEQFSRVHGATGPWTDVFALALIATELLTGNPALDGEDLVQFAFSARNPARRPTPRTLGASLPDAVEAVFEKAVAVQPALRFGRARDFWSALECAVAESITRTEAVTISAASVDDALSAPKARARTTEPSTSPRAAAPHPGASITRRWMAGSIGGLALIAVGALLVRTHHSDPSTAGSATITTGPAAPGASSLVQGGTLCPTGMFEIPAGQFYMGSDDEGAPNTEKPSHNVSLRAFCMDGFEVTAADYERCSARGACRRLQPRVSYKAMTPLEEKAFLPLCNAGVRDRAQHPMNCIGWQDADTYCRRTGKRLPTEAEWEYATRGPDGRNYPWGDDPPTTAHLNACDADCASWAKQAGVPVLVLFTNETDGFAATAPVGRFDKGRSRFGPWDVAGNVWEWVADWDSPYRADEQDNPTGPADGEKKVIRGGAWNGARTEWLRPSFRFAAEPERRHPAIGFRCAVSPNRGP